MFGIGRLLDITAEEQTAATRSGFLSESVLDVVDVRL